MVKKYLTKAELAAMTNQEIQRAWNELSLFFTKNAPIPRPDTVVVGFFQLSNETGRRGLQIGKDKAGKIILEPKKVNHGSQQV
jgi:hypothetical protein